jgi:hypothetical protein
VRVADVGGEEFQEAERCTLAGVGDQRGQGRGRGAQGELVHDVLSAQGGKDGGLIQAPIWLSALQDKLFPRKGRSEGEFVHQ